MCAIILVDSKGNPVATNADLVSVLNCLLCTKTVTDMDLLPPPVISGFEPPMGAVPGLGEHTDAVLSELGMTPDEIAALRDAGAIGPAY